MVELQNVDRVFRPKKSAEINEEVGSVDQRFLFLRVIFRIK